MKFWRGLAAAAIALPPIAVAAPAQATQTVCVEIVVDYGGTSGAPAQPSTTCVTVPAGSTGADVLSARAKKLGKPAARYNPDGFVCAIDNVPSSGCAESDPSAPYWSYWHKNGDGSWTFSNNGAFNYTISGTHPGEGWRYEPVKPQIPPPNPRYEAVCPATVATTPPPTHSTTASTAPTTASPTPLDIATQSAAAAKSPAPKLSPAQSARTTRALTTTATVTPTPTPVRLRAKRTSSSGPPTAPIVGGALVVGLGTAAFIRNRRRRIT